MAETAFVVWHIGDVVRKLREARGLSQRALATAARIRPNTLGELERGMSNFERETLQKVAIALHVTIDGLYAELPSLKLSPNIDPADAETIARYLKLERDQRNAVRIVVDQLGLYPDRQRAPGTDGGNASEPPASSHSGP